MATFLLTAIAAVIGLVLLCLSYMASLAEDKGVARRWFIAALVAFAVAGWGVHDMVSA